jgi:threonine-phosphate decarboxylase
MNHHGGDIYRFKREMLDFSSNINPLGVPDCFKKALRERGDDFGRYPDSAYRALKQNIATYLGVDPEYVTTGNGAVDNIYQAVKAAQKDRVLGIAPAFSEYRGAAEWAGLNYEAAKAFDEAYSRIDFAKILQRAQRDTTVILGNPNNPTGSLESAAGLCSLAAELAKRDSTLIVDEAFIEFIEEAAGHTMLPFIRTFPNLIVIRAATKFFGLPGIRLGYALTGNPVLRRRMNDLTQPWNINTSAVIAGEVIFKDHEYIQATREWLKQERRLFEERLQALPNLKVYPSQANFYLLRSERSDLDAHVLYEKLISRGILIRTPDGFGNLTSYHFRVALKDRVSNEVLCQALREVLG